MRYIHSLRTIHPGVELTIGDLTPHPHTRLSITTTFMVLSGKLQVLISIYSVLINDMARFMHE